MYISCGQTTALYSYVWFRLDGSRLGVQNVLEAKRRAQVCGTDFQPNRVQTSFGAVTRRVVVVGMEDIWREF